MSRFVNVFPRVFVLVLVGVSVLWIPVVQASQGGQLFIYIQSISTYLQPPVSIVFIMGCFWKRTNEKPQCYQTDDRPGVLKHVHYLYFSMLLSAITLIVVVTLSLVTEEPRPEQISRLTWFSRSDPVETKEQVFTVEHSSNGADVPTNQGKQSRTNGGSFERRASTSSSVLHQSKLVSALYWLCGMERRQEDSNPPPPVQPDICSLEEKPHLKKLVNVNLIICLTVTVFIIGYWA